MLCSKERTIILPCPIYLAVVCDPDAIRDVINGKHSAVTQQAVPHLVFQLAADVHVSLEFAGAYVVDTCIQESINDSCHVTVAVLGEELCTLRLTGLVTPTIRSKTTMSISRD